MLQFKRQSHRPRQTITTTETTRNQQDHQGRLPLDMGSSTGRWWQSHIALYYREDGFVSRYLVRCWYEHDIESRSSTIDASQGISVPCESCKHHRRIRAARSVKEYCRQEFVRLVY